MADFSRWTGRARRSLVLAHEQARLLNHHEISDGHLLLGLLAEGESVAFQALAALGADLESACEAIAGREPPGTRESPGRLPFSPRARKACELALREAIQLGVSYVGTEHVLLGLVRVSEGNDIFAALGLNPGEVRVKVIDLLRGYEKAEARPAVPPRSDDEMSRMRDAALLLHRTTCERCCLLALLCEDCRQAVGECLVHRAIERAPWKEAVADGS